MAKVADRVELASHQTAGAVGGDDWVHALTVVADVSGGGKLLTGTVKALENDLVCAGLHDRNPDSLQR